MLKRIIVVAALALSIFGTGVAAEVAGYDVVPTASACSSAGGGGGGC